MLKPLYERLSQRRAQSQQPIEGGEDTDIDGEEKVRLAK